MLILFNFLQVLIEKVQQQFASYAKISIQQIMQVPRLNRCKALLLICDIQQKFLPKVYGYEGVRDSSILSLKIANTFNIPVIATQHYPKAFGKIIPEITSILPNNHTIIEKTTFSMINEGVQAALKSHPDRSQVILVGMQTHVCIVQTFIDLKLRNYEVFLPFDAITSIRASDRTYAIQRMLSQGGIATSVQSLAFELLGNYKDEHFKTVANLLKQAGPRANVISHI